MLQPEELKKTAPGYERENLRFRSFLKKYADSAELDQLFEELHNRLFDGYDCCSCGNCCRDFNICFSDEDIKRIAEHLNLTEAGFISSFLTVDDEGEYVVEPPCIFLEPDGRCRIQICKPVECAGFPFTDKPDRLSCLYGVMDFAQSCPVVFEIVEELKQIYGFRRRAES